MTLASATALPGRLPTATPLSTRRQRPSRREIEGSSGGREIVDIDRPGFLVASRKVPTIRSPSRATYTRDVRERVAHAFLRRDTGPGAFAVLIGQALGHRIVQCRVA